MSNTASLKKEYQDRIVPALTKEFGYKSVMQVPVLKKIVINQGLGMAGDDDVWRLQKIEVGLEIVEKRQMEDERV